MCSLPNEKTRKKWMNEVTWLELNDANLMICKKCYLLAEQNETLMCNTSKFVQGNSNYQKFSFRYHNLSELHDLTCKSKENLDTQKAGLSIPPRKVVQQIPPASATAKSVQQINEKDRATVMKLNNIACYIALHGLSFTRFEHLGKFHDVTFTGAYENESAC